VDGIYYIYIYRAGADFNSLKRDVTGKGGVLCGRKIYMDIEPKLLDTESLRNAVTALEDAIAEYNDNTSGGNIRLLDALRSGVIKNFEVAYELCWKYMKKWLEMNISPDIVQGVPRKEFYRIACENGLISDVKEWWDFHDSRNRTVHVYCATTAEEVFNAALKFIDAAKRFTAGLEGKI